VDSIGKGHESGKALSCFLPFSLDGYPVSLVVWACKRWERDENEKWTIGQLKPEITKSQIGLGIPLHGRSNLSSCNCAPGDRQEVGDERALQSKE